MKNTEGNSEDEDGENDDNISTGVIEGTIAMHAYS